MVHKGACQGEGYSIFTCISTPPCSRKRRIKARESEESPSFCFGVSFKITSVLNNMHRTCINRWMPNTVSAPVLLPAEKTAINAFLSSFWPPVFRKEAKIVWCVRTLLSSSLHYWEKESVKVLTKALLAYQGSPRDLETPPIPRLCCTVCILLIFTDIIPQIRCQGSA